MKKNDKNHLNCNLKKVSSSGSAVFNLTQETRITILEDGRLDTRQWRSQETESNLSSMTWANVWQMICAICKVYKKRIQLCVLLYAQYIGVHNYIFHSNCKYISFLQGFVNFKSFLRKTVSLF